MARPRQRGRRLEADFTEDTVALVIDSYLAVASFPHCGLTVELFSRRWERRLGADARITGFMPFYMQFKRPSAYPGDSRAKVVLDRKRLNPPLTTMPQTFFFELRNKRTGQADYQHNILYRLRQRLVRWGLGDAAYVCPLFLEREAYRFHMYLCALRLWTRFGTLVPVSLGGVVIMDGGTASFSNIPILSEHVSIPPHKPVTTADHCYSFLPTGNEICFHSPEQVTQEPMKLDRWLDDLLSNTAGQQRLILREEAKSTLRQLLEPTQDDDALPYPQDLLANRDDIESWLAWGDYLWSEYEIQQYAFVRWED
ncbi:hypothetical protein J2Z79_001678 [Symbiobacterium terraclitae]|uniref:Uncharacterized protein n=1 Tax=Symbiobacterium terraclitae TaxID=557451 RepID=A0ABS4JRX0_9FIRM|nr:hypothetical protein [Symbiobacterium terraclitae]